MSLSPRVPSKIRADYSYRSVRASFPNEKFISVSFVIPAMNEEATLEELVQGILTNVPDAFTAEIIFIDDGSTDDTWPVIQALADLHPDTVRGLRFRSNRGKAAALQVGFEAAAGELIFTMDADLQDDPREIPQFIEKINEGYDLVSGWKAVRHDPWHKVLPSRIFNRMLSRFSQVKLHDHNCGFKCYRRDVAKSIDLFGELHRMVPSLAGMQGFKVTEIVVRHHARQFGESKYGIERFIRGFSDMLTMGFLRVYRERPGHFANACCAVHISAAVAAFGASFFCGLNSMTGVVLLVTGVGLLAISNVCFLIGVFSELMIRKSQLQPACDHIVIDTDQNRQQGSKQAEQVNPATVQSGVAADSGKGGSKQRELQPV